MHAQLKPTQTPGEHNTKSSTSADMAVQKHGVIVSPWGALPLVTEETEEEDSYPCIFFKPIM